MNISFKGKTALVTGAGKGLGRAIAKALPAGGATVHAISRTQADLDSLQQEVAGIQVYNVDVTDWDKVRKVVQDIGRVDLLVNNAGILSLMPLLDATKEEFEQIMTTNTTAAFNISQVVSKLMILHGHGGAIVNISSVDALKPDTTYPVYCISKAAMDMVTKCFALEVAQYQIRVNSVNPTLVPQTKSGQLIDKTKADQLATQTPMKKFAEISDVVHAVLYLLSDKADMITGTSLPIEGGFLLS